jgi:single-stranded DNA-binding protein
VVFHNHVILTGKVAKPPLRHCRPDGSPVVQFVLELNQQEGAPDDGKRSRIDIVAVGKSAEVEPGLLQFGQHLLVEGRLQQRRWKTAEGRESSRVEVIATDFRKVE